MTAPTPTATSPATTETAAPAGTPAAGTPDVVPAAPAQETDWKAEARKWEDRAKANTKAAERLAEIEESNKTELQKATDRAAAAEAKAAEVGARAMRAEVAAAKGIPAALLSGSTQEELEASADALLAFRGPATRTATAEEAGAGARGEAIGTPKQLTRDDLKSMSASQILAAQKAGQLKTLTQGS